MSDITRPTEAERLVEEDSGGTVPGLACVVVIEHLRLLGPNARVGILANTEKIIEYDCLSGPNGLLRNFPDDFSRKTKMRFNHKGGGQVNCYTTAPHPASQYVHGSIFSLLWVENFDTSERNAKELLETARRYLRLGPNPRIIYSKEGLITPDGE